jgi:hypothetical protein
LQGDHRAGGVDDHARLRPRLFRVKRGYPRLPLRASAVPKGFTGHGSCGTRFRQPLPLPNTLPQLKTWIVSLHRIWRRLVWVFRSLCKAADHPLAPPPRPRLRSALHSIDGSCTSSASAGERLLHVVPP